MRRGLSAAIVVLFALTGLAACGDDGAGASTETKTVAVTVKDGKVTPAGDRINVDVNQPVDIVITSDEPGKLHVHSSPETTKDFDAGTNPPIELQFDRPGVVEIELHEPFDGPVVSLEVQ
jgi:hypothetical protein